MMIFGTCSYLLLTNKNVFTSKLCHLIQKGIPVHGLDLLNMYK